MNFLIHSRFVKSSSNSSTIFRVEFQNLKKKKKVNQVQVGFKLRVFLIKSNSSLTLYRPDSTTTLVLGVVGSHTRMEPHILFSFFFLFFVTETKLQGTSKSRVIQGKQFDSSWGLYTKNKTLIVQKKNNK